MKIKGDLWVERHEDTGEPCIYNDATLKVLASISSWTIPNIAPDVSAEEKLAIIREELGKILV